MKDSESRRFEPNIGLNFSQADVGPTSAPDLRAFPKVRNFFFSKRAHGKRILTIFGGYL